ncbi:hypothetical protein S40293_10226 [Stachybotrys chartarum IBT 40293]|nr:hypothetical protein S40293_10226 [Stachybotrys chartarum IBT 40293]
MRILGPGRAQWEWFVALHPLFELALPPKEPPAEIRASPGLQNDVALIRQAIRAMPLVFPNIDLDRELEESKYYVFCDALLSLLKVLETLVDEDVVGLGAQEHNMGVPQEESKLCAIFPKLAILKSILGQAASGAAAANRSNTEAHSKLAAYIDYIGFGKSRKYNSRQVVTAIRTFRAQIDDIFDDPLEALERNLGNAGTFNEKEISFIRRANKLNDLSQSLFTMLVESITCPKTHKARLHLSGFLDADVNFELLITECGKEQWKVANFTLVDQQRPRSSSSATHGLLRAHWQLARAGSESITITFDGEEVWDDEVHGLLAADDQVTDSTRTLLEVLRPKPANDEDDSDPELDVQEFVEEDQKVVELLVASSLLNLNTSAWMRADMNIKTILLEHSPSRGRRWKPLVTCHLQSTAFDGNVHDAILSFGLLLMEMERKKTAKPKDTDMDWETGLPSKDSILKRIIEEWSRSVSDGYRHVATACLQFRELSAMLYDPALDPKMKQTAAIYKYILAPLHRLITQQHSKISRMFNEFPGALQSPEASRSSSLRLPIRSPGLVLFDGVDTHDPTAIKNAKTFWESVKSFRDMINNLSSSSPISPLADPCRKEKIRVAIIDTGIDTDDDITIEQAVEDGRIKERCGFVNGPDAKPDPYDYKDNFGHGTHVARFMLWMAPAVELYIAKISNEPTIQPNDLHRVARAIKWAHKDKHVHIISMSFGLETPRNLEIDKAIVAAKRDGITMFAAAANSGGNKPRAYPSSRGSPVICVHASDGLGNDGGISPNPEPDESNFSTLGISIASKWKGDDVLKSGTSFATPIAAAFAADVLEFARHKCDLDESGLQNLCDYDGMHKILKLMARKRQDYDYVTPLHLWTIETTAEDIVKKLNKIAGC